MARTPPKPAHKASALLVIRFAGHAGLVALFIVVALLGVLSGVMFAYAGDLPQISALDRYAPSAITRVYARNGETLAEFAIERRLIVGYDDIAPQLREAIISAEDKNFNSHFGLSVSALVLRLANDLLHRRMVAGASTLTMQLARGLFAQEVGFQIGDKSPERKIKEILVAIQIEKRYTKREILTFYANQMLFGHGTYGVEAASRLYFNKRAKDLTLEEAAMLAGIIQSPARQSPFVDRAAATRRRNYVLQQMADNGYITQTQADAAKNTPIVTRGQPQPLKSVAPFFAEEIRKYLEQKYGAKKLYEGEVDFFGVYCPDNQTCYLVPAESLPREMASLRLTPPRNGQANLATFCSHLPISLAIGVSIPRGPSEPPTRSSNADFAISRTS